MSKQPHVLEELNPDLPQVPSAAPADVVIPLAPVPRTRGKAKRVAEILTNFVFGQAASQGISVLASLFLVHRLSIEAYAQFGLATGFQTVFSILMDLGFASTIVPLVGERTGDKPLIGRYVRAARHLRNRTFLALAPVAALFFIATAYRHHWPWSLQALLLVSVLLSLYSGGKVSYFSAPLFIYGRIREYYLPQVISGSGRMLAYIALAFTGGLNAWTAAGLSALNITLNGSLIERASRKYITWPAKEDPAVDREMLKYILPASPAIIFSAFQSQISLFLVSFFGGTLNIAEVTALSRIGQLFAVAMTFNVIVIEPYVARHARRGLLRVFVLIALASGSLCIPVILAAFYWPKVFIFIIGAKYAGVSPLMGWFILSCCMNHVSGLVWVMNRARKWVFWSGSIIEVALVLVVQIAFLARYGVRTTRQAVFFGVASACCYAVAHGYVAVVGFWKERDGAAASG